MQQRLQANNVRALTGHDGTVRLGVGARHEDWRVLMDDNQIGGHVIEVIKIAPRGKAY